MVMARIHVPPKEWMPIAGAPSDNDLEVCVIDGQGVHALAFPCRRIESGWIDATGRKLIEIHPTHWRLWTENQEVH